MNDKDRSGHGMTTTETLFRKERLQAIVDDRQSGAAQLGRIALQTLADYSQVCALEDPETYTEALLDYAQALQNARPSMAPLVNLIEAWSNWLKAEPDRRLEHLRETALNTAHDLVKQSEEAVSHIAGHVAALIGEDSVVMTHSVSSTVLACYRALSEKNVNAVITESRPGYEGRRVAQSLVEMTVSAEFITEAQMGLFVDQADAVVVGADTVLADGAVVNKAGTFLLALAARHAGVPFYVCAETFKRSDRTAGDVQLEEMSADELDLPTLPHITPHNIYFDITPAELITAWINEHGVKKY